MSCCGSFSEISIKSSSFNFQGIRKRAILVLSDSKSKGWEKIGNIKELLSQILDGIRTLQDLVQISGKQQNLNETNSTKIIHTRVQFRTRV